MYLDKMWVEKRNLLYLLKIIASTKSKMKDNMFEKVTPKCKKIAFQIEYNFGIPKI